MVFHLPLRQTEDFLRSLADLLEVDLPIPDHTRLSRRLKKLGDIRFRRLATDRPIHLVIDSTGLRIHVGNLRKPSRNRVWRKLHLAVDADTGEILASDLTSRRTHDCTQVPALLEQIDNPVVSILADGAYDTRQVYEAAHEHGEGRTVRVLIPPGRDAQTIIGRSMRSRTFAGQRVEVGLACKILNTMTHLWDAGELPSAVSRAQGVEDRSSVRSHAPTLTGEVDGPVRRDRDARRRRVHVVARQPHREDRSAKDRLGVTTTHITPCGTTP